MSAGNKQHGPAENLNLCYLRNPFLCEQCMWCFIDATRPNKAFLINLQLWLQMKLPCCETVRGFRFTSLRVAKKLYCYDFILISSTGFSDFLALCSQFAYASEINLINTLYILSPFISMHGSIHSGRVNRI